MDTDMALDGVVNLQQDEDSQYEQHERDAMKAIELSDLKKETCTLADKLENGLKDDIFAKNEEYVMRTEMGTLFASTVLPSEAPKQGEGEADSSFRIRIMKYLLKNALPKEGLPEGISAGVIDEKVPDLTTNDILALHYFQLLRHIPGKSKPDAICGPLTMKDLLAANGVDLKDKLGDDYIEQEDFVFTKDVEKIEDREKLNQYDLSGVTSNGIIYKIGERYYFTWKNADGTQGISELCKKDNNSTTKNQGDDNSKSNTDGNKNLDSKLLGVDSFKSKYFNDNQELFSAFMETIPSINNNNVFVKKVVDRIKQSTNVVLSSGDQTNDVGAALAHIISYLHESVVPDSFYVTEKEGKFMLTFTQTYENQLCGINIGEIDLSKCVTTDNGGKVSWNKNGYTTEVNRLCKEYETQQSAQEVVNDAIKATGYSLSDLYGRGDHKCNDPYYKTFMDKYAGTRDMTDSINLHPNATRPSLDGKKMRYTLGNLDFNTGYKEAPYLKGKRVDLNVITDKQGKFDETKRKKHLAGVIDDCVTKYAAASSKNVQQAPSA